jgi:hypothetical protein
VHSVPQVATGNQSGNFTQSQDSKIGRDCFVGTPATRSKTSKPAEQYGKYTAQTDFDSKKMKKEIQVKRKWSNTIIFSV